MRHTDGSIRLSPTDLSGYLSCRHRTGLDLSEAMGLLTRPSWSDPAADALRQRGEEHERAYVASLRASGLRVVDVSAEPDRPAATLAALRSGADVVVQAVLEAERWRGYADVLRRVERPSALGSWSYEVYDTKLARDTRGGTILQLAVYSDLLAGVQGVRPERFHVVTPDPVAPLHSFRVDEFAAYYRLTRRQLLEDLARGPQGLRETYYPEPVDLCEVCRWWALCNDRRRTDDHLSFIAGIGRQQRAEFEARGVTTLAQAAATPVPLPFKPSRGSRETYERLCEQARVQHEQRTLGTPVFELLPVEAGLGLARLPQPSAGDLFLDLEGARFAREGGREYLFGLWSPAGYREWWAHDDAQEKAAFEAVMDVVAKAWAGDPGMHVYHFGHYEPSAFKRLMGRYATRAEELDRLLRAERFVNLHAVVRQAVRAGVESYSIKRLEPFYGFTRAVPLDEASQYLQAADLALEAGDPGAITGEMRERIAGYNKDDCRSTEALRGWLEQLRAGIEAGGAEIGRPEPKEADAADEVSDLDREAEAIRAALLEGLPADASTPSHPEHPRWLLAYLVDWHRREDKAQWWEYFRLREVPDEDLLDEPRALTGLEFVRRDEVVLSKRGKPTGSVVDRYRFPGQEVEIGRGARLGTRDRSSFGSVVSIDRESREVVIRKGPSHAEEHPAALFESEYVRTGILQRAVMRLALDPDAVTCGVDLLFRRPPRLVSTSFARLDGEDDVAFAVRVVANLDRSALAIQGPPGAGKTHTGAAMIRALVRAGKRVGVTAVSHKVIRNLLDAVQGQAHRAGEAVGLGHKVNEESGASTVVREFTDNGAALDAVRSREVHVLGGTAWLWAREEAAGSVDVLFVDEAGQMSLANALAVSGAAASLVLLGDPQQLEQPQKGTHPDGVNVSALEHVLSGRKTMPPGRGLFLPVTWRLAPSVCAFTSEVFYEGKLGPRAGLERQRLQGCGPFDGAGLWWVPAEHDGNQNSSQEEVEVVAGIVERLLAAGAAWVDGQDVVHLLGPADIRVVAPYNAQVNRLAERLAHRGVPVGTVDKFQGQEAPVVVYSMATSRPEDAPRGMEFLYSLNRLNVATSRARCAAIVVASPRLFEPACRTPRQMQLANALCRYAELARSVPQSSLPETNRGLHPAAHGAVMSFDLERFVAAQDHEGAFDAALAELRRGRKESHWIWFVFPQLRGLAKSKVATWYGLDGVAEAGAYLDHPVLRARLLEAVDVVCAQLRGGARIDDLMGSVVDTLKLVSSTTLFEAVARARRDPDPAGDVARLAAAAAEVLATAEAQGYPRCRFTLQQVLER